MPDLVTFVFTDLVGSVDLKGRMPGADAAERDSAYVRLVLTPHRERIEAGLADRGGRVVSTAGDGHFLAFRDTIQAALWAIGVQRSHAEQPIAVADDHSAEDGEPPTARVRIGLHVGPPQTDPADPTNFIGRAVDYAARLADRAVAGQILASRSAASLLEDAGLEGLLLHAHGRRGLRGIGDVEVHELLYGGRAPSEPRPAESDAAETDRREWTVLPPTMSLTQYIGDSAASSKGSSKGSSATSALAPPARKLGNYELGELIGAGGMGNVYRARHTLFGRTRAVKLIKPELVSAGGDSVVKRFYQEVRATGAIEHPNLVVAIDSSSPEDEQHYLVMEYIDGVGVDRVLTAEGRLPVAEACEVARQAALGLAHLHQAGLVHRDVKPSNLMLTLAADPDGSGDPSSSSAPRAVVKLMDLGLALLSRGEGGPGDQGRITRMNHGGMGTGHYMSPEQWRTTSVDIRADIYSLGCTLHHLIRGLPPFADSELRPEVAHGRESAPKLDRAVASDELQQLLDRMMAKRPEERPQTPLDVARELAPFASPHRLAGVVERNRVYAGASSGLAGAAGGYGDTYGDRHATDTLAPRPTPAGPAAVRAESGAPARHRTALWGGLLATALVVAGVLAWFVGEQRGRMLASHRRALAAVSVAASDNMAGQIKDRFTALRTAADDARLVGWLSAIEEAGGADDSQDQLQRWISKKKAESRKRFDSNSWFITDRRGSQVARWPEGKTIGKNFAHRDYFHGKGAEHDPNAPPAPIGSAHQSVVYKSSSTGELKVAFSVPVLDREDGENVLGVLSMSVALGEFDELLRAKDPSIEVVLVNTELDDVNEDEPQSGLVMQHDELEEYPDRTFRLDQAMLGKLTDRRKGLLERYDDIFGRDRGPYWGYYTQVEIDKRLQLPKSGWVVIAQEPIP